MEEDNLVGRQIGEKDSKNAKIKEKTAKASQRLRLQTAEGKKDGVMQRGGGEFEDRVMWMGAWDPG